MTAPLPPPEPRPVAERRPADDPAPADTSPATGPTDGSVGVDGSVGADRSIETRRRRGPGPIAARDAEAVFVASDPPRTSHLALWHPDGVPQGITGVPADAPAGTLDADRIGTIDLVWPAGSSGRVRSHTVTARLVPVAEAIDWLAAFSPSDDTSASLAAWVVAARLGLDLLARGRMLPGITPAGWDTWRVGPLDLDDDRRLHDLLEALPPRAHAVRLPDTRPLRIVEATDAVRGLWDAMADALVRTAAAPAVAGPGLDRGRGEPVPFAGVEPTPVTRWANWLEANGRGLTGGGGKARPVLRIDLPKGAEPRPVAGGPDGGEPGTGPGTDHLSLRGTLQLRSTTDPSLVVDAADLWAASGAVRAHLGADAETDLLLGLRRGALAWPPLQRTLEDAHPTGLDIDDDEALELLGTAGADLATAGFDILWPAELTRTETVALHGVLTDSVPDLDPYGVGAPATVVSSGLDLDAILRFEWRGSIAGHTLTAAELHELAEAKRPIVRVRGRWVVADPRLAERLAGRRPAVRGGDALAAALAGSITIDGEDVDLVVEGPLATLAERLRSLDTARELPEPPGLTATLRPYQRRGLAWLAEMTELGLGGCLADDMGLGKTVQLIALHLHRHQPGHAPSGPTLVVCPTSLLGNWERELHRFAPGVPVRRYHGGDRHLDDLAPTEVVLATYGVVRRDRASLAATPWGLVVADEAQHVKNPHARTARELRLIPADARVALTGTPVENRLSELWAILDWTTPGLLGPLDRFRQQVAVPIERHRDPDATERFAKLVRPFLLRRRKIDPGIAPELPAKTETDQVVALTAEQVTLYEAVVRETLAEISTAQGIARRGLVLKLLTGLKQITNHPAQYLHQAGPLAGRSGKLAALDELLDAIVDAEDSALVFTQYVTMGTLLEAHLASRGIPSLFLHGKVTATAREHLVDRFQAGEVPVFLLSLKAGGTGLNLTRASHVVHYDRWWNPAVEDQATDRAHRIGQTRAVQVHRLISEGTVEDRISALLERKRALADAVVGTGEGWIGDLSDDELRELVVYHEEAAT